MQRQQLSEISDSDIYVAYGLGLMEMSTDVRDIHIEQQPYGGFCTVTLDNSDLSYNGFDHRGEELRIETGFSGDRAGGEWPYFWIENPSLLSYRDKYSGRLLRVISCITVWGIIGGWRYEHYPRPATEPPVAWRIGDNTKTLKVMLDTVLAKIGVTLYASESEDDLVDNAEYKPLLWIYPGEDGITVVQRILSNCACVLKPYQDGLRLYHPTVKSIVSGSDANNYECILEHTAAVGNKPITGGSWATYWQSTDQNYIDYWAVGREYYCPAVDYAYSGEHVVYSNVEASPVFRPNRVTVYSETKAGTYTWPELAGGSVATYPLEINRRDTDWTQAKCERVAEAVVKRARQDVHGGHSQMSINVGQEVYDNVQITDGRSRETYEGRVARVVAKWSSSLHPGMKSQYKMELDLGGLFFDSTPDDDSPTAVNSGGDISSLIDRINVQGGISGQAIAPHTLLYALLNTTQDYEIELTCPNGTHTATDFNWGEGTIKFQDGTKKTIKASFFGTVAGHALTGTHHLYFDFNEVDGSGKLLLQETTDIKDTVGHDKGRVLWCIKATESGDLCQICIPRGKTTLINADAVVCQYLSSLVLDAGVADLGVVNAGIAKFLETGTNWNSFADPDTATGLVLGLDTAPSPDVGKLIGYDSGVAQAYFTSDGNINAGAGKVVLDSSGISMHGHGLNTIFQFYNSSGTWGGAIWLVDAAGTLRVEGLAGLYVKGPLTVNDAAAKSTIKSDSCALTLAPSGTYPVVIEGGHSIKAESGHDLTIGTYVGQGLILDTVDVDAETAAYIDLPQQAGHPAAHDGRFFYNTTDDVIEGYSNGGWHSL